eukprot:GHUV01048012.1.p1 GENE.GHUV01048012.1~~GHUV01048012.1.p1  ORF type:complete len:148 (+),score=40.48 GHUV01048012.1:315-758(+)
MCMGVVASLRIVLKRPSCGVLQALDEVKVREVALVELQKRITDGDSKLKQQQALYEAVRADRNMYSKSLIEAQVGLQGHIACCCCPAALVPSCSECVYLQQLCRAGWSARWYIQHSSGLAEGCGVGAISPWGCAANACYSPLLGQFT